jgi:HlyD family secretion protein
MSNPWIKRIAIAVLVVVVAGVGWKFLGRTGSAKVTYDMATVDKGTVEKTVSSSGSVAALVTVDVGSQISGQIAELHVDFNSKVKKGDLLAVIDPQTYKSRVASAEADLAVARANLGSQEANLTKAKTSLDQWARDIKRQEELAAEKLIAQSALEDSRKQNELAKSDLLIAQAQIKNATAGLQTKQSNLDQARIDLSRTQIRSPIDGVVIQRSIDLGQTVAASLQAPLLFRIAQDMSRIQIEAKVDEADIGSIKPEDAATFTVDAFPDQSFRGRVAQVRLASTTVQNVVTYSVMVQADNPREILLPGMTANVRIVTDRRDNVLRIANDAARFQPAGAARTDAPGAAAGGFDFGGGGPPGGAQGGQRNPGGINAEQAKELGLTAEQQAKLEKARTELFAQFRAQGGGAGGGGPTGIAGGGGFPGGGGGFPGPGGGGGFPGGGNNNQGQAMRNRIENMMASVLTPEQMEKFRAQRSQRTNGPGAARRGTLWSLEGNVPKVHEVRLGVADDRYTEIVSGGAKEGDKFIVRAHSEVKK